MRCWSLALYPNLQTTPSKNVKQTWHLYQRLLPWKSMQFENPLHEYIFNVISLMRRLNRCKICYLCQLFHHNHDGIMMSPIHWQSCNEIHGNNFSFPFGNWKRLQQPIQCLCSTFTCWHFMHLEMYWAMSFFIPGQKYCFLTVAIVFWYPGWP